VNDTALSQIVDCPSCRTVSKAVVLAGTRLAGYISIVGFVRHQYMRLLNENDQDIRWFFPYGNWDHRNFFAQLQRADQRQPLQIVADR
jgi:hypothetical protein